MARPISSYRETVSPRVFLEADGEFAQDLLDDMQKFEFSDDEKKPNEVTLTINNPGFKYTDDKRFLEGVRFKVRWGFAGDFSGIFAVSISKAAPDFPKSGSMPTIIMKAWDIRADMGRISNPTNHGSVPSSRVAKNIAKRYNMDEDIEESNDARTKMRVQPAGTNDIQYLMSLASKLNWDCYIEGKTLHFHKKRLERDPVLTFRYFDDAVGTVMEFKPDVKLQKPSGVKKAGSNPKDAKGAGGSAGSNPAGDTALAKWRVNTNQAKFTELIRGTNVRSPGGSSSTSSTPENDKKVANIQAGAAKQKIDLSAVTATLKVIGTPRLLARTNIRMEGVGKAYSGNWRVSSTKHTITKDGYYVEAKLSRNALNKGKTAASKTNDKTGSGAGGDGGQKKVVEVSGTNASFGGTKFK